MEEDFAAADLLRAGDGVIMDDAIKPGAWVLNNDFLI